MRTVANISPIVPIFRANVCKEIPINRILMTIPLAGFVRDLSVGSIVAIVLAIAAFETDGSGSRKIDPATLRMC